MATNSKGDNATKSVSMPPDLLSAAQDRVTRLKLANFSAYVRKLIEQDIAVGGALIYEDSTDPATPPRAAKPVKPVSYLKHPKRKAG